MSAARTLVQGDGSVRWRLDEDQPWSYVGALHRVAAGWGYSGSGRTGITSLRRDAVAVLVQAALDARTIP